MVDKSGKRGVRVFLGFPATWTFQTDEAFEIMPGHVLHMEYVQTTLLNQPTSELGPYVSWLVARMLEDISLQRFPHIKRDQRNS